MRKLAIIATHPVQYYAPLFKALTARGEATIKVFYTWGVQSVEKYDPGFQRQVKWDIPLLEGYEYAFLQNSSKMPGTKTFRGIVNPDAIKEIESFDPDALLVYGWSWQAHLRIIRHFSGKVPVWFRGDSTLLDETKGIKKVLRSLFLRWVYHYVDAAFYVGSQNKAYFQKFGLTEGQLQFAPHAIDNDRFGQPQTEEAKAIRDGLGLTAEDILVLFAGKLEPKKDPILLLEAFEAIEQENLHLLFAGNGVLEESLKARAALSPKKEKIFFLPFQNQGRMPALYQACDLFCLPSRGPGETWGLAINEAMAAGKAVLAADKVGCAPDLVKEGINGAVFKGGRQEELVQKLAILVREKANLAAMGRQSAKVIQNWSFDQQVSAILARLNKC